MRSGSHFRYKPSRSQRREYSNNCSDTINTNVSVSDAAKRKVIRRRKIKCIVPNCDYESEIDSNCLKKHCEKDHQWGVYPCTENDNCQFEAYSKQSLIAHIGMFHKEWESRGHGPEQCSKKDCIASYKLASHLQEHEDIHNNTLRFKCSYCPYKALKRKQFLDHLAIHFKNHQYVCGICEHIARTKQDLERHQERHTETQYKCTICSTLFGTSSYLNVHLRNKHNIREKRAEYCIVIEPGDSLNMTREIIAAKRPFGPTESTPLKKIPRTSQLSIRESMVTSDSSLGCSDDSNVSCDMSDFSLRSGDDSDASCYMEDDQERSNSTIGSQSYSVDWMNRLKQEDDRGEESLAQEISILQQQLGRVIKKRNEKRTGTKRSRRQRSEKKIVALQQELQKAKNELNETITIMTNTSKSLALLADQTKKCLSSEKTA